MCIRIEKDLFYLPVNGNVLGRQQVLLFLIDKLDLCKNALGMLLL